MPSLVRARTDPAFRRKLVADSLDMLLGELNRLRNRGGDIAAIREGVDLAVQLADLLQRIRQTTASQPS